MPKVDYRRYTLDQRQYCFELVMKTLEAFGLPESGQTFLADLLRESEVTMFARRIEIARHLLLGWSFERIKEKLHVGTKTVETIDRWLEAKLPEYRREISQADNDMTSLWQQLRKKYAHHALFIDILFRRAT